ncbi:unnamed protein product [Menidia menidia]|uniref:(Atlantic silverside) hypothetical protein n=1 Tax=Menidia menidia TaxID=238744 RepID=A0A8S4B7D8_9TELE|nr:unnamed protein product [Menidia menidia]
MDILKSLGHPEEIFNLFKFKMGGCRAVMPKLDYKMSSAAVPCMYQQVSAKRNFIHLCLL